MPHHIKYQGAPSFAQTVAGQDPVCESFEITIFDQTDMANIIEYINANNDATRSNLITQDGTQASEYPVPAAAFATSGTTTTTTTYVKPTVYQHFRTYGGMKIYMQYLKAIIQLTNSGTTDVTIEVVKTRFKRDITASQENNELQGLGGFLGFCTNQAWPMMPADTSIIHYGPMNYNINHPSVKIQYFYPLLKKYHKIYKHYKFTLKAGKQTNIILLNKLHKMWDPRQQEFMGSLAGDSTINYWAGLTKCLMWRIIPKKGISSSTLEATHVTDWETFRVGVHATYDWKFTTYPDKRTRLLNETVAVHRYPQETIHMNKLRKFGNQYAGTSTVPSNTTTAIEIAP